MEAPIIPMNDRILYLESGTRLHTYRFLVGDIISDREEYRNNTSKGETGIICGIQTWPAPKYLIYWMEVKELVFEDREFIESWHTTIRNLY